MALADVSETIAAIASAPGGGIRGVIRLSGNDTVKIIGRVFTPDSGQPQLAHVQRATAVPGALRLSESETLPGRLLLWPNQQSYTRQPSAEFHTIGSPPLLNLALEAISAAGARQAEPGEFTLRAFLSGRIDLTQAEAVLGVIDARGQDQLKTALRQLAGGLAGPLDEIRNELISVLAELEAGLDFVEEDIEFISREQLETTLRRIEQQLTDICSQIHSREINQAELKVILVGSPNAGKSSLFNALIGQTETIVTNIAGTTRDYVSGELRCGELTLQLIDTAGLDDAATLTDAGQIDAKAQTQTARQLEQADLRLICIAANSQGNLPMQNPLPARQPHDIVVITKTDVLTDPEIQIPRFQQQKAAGNIVVGTSVQTSSGLDELKRHVAGAASEMYFSRTEIVSSTATRTRGSLSGATDAVREALAAVVQDLGMEIVAAECRGALEELGKVVGRIYTDDILDQVFSRFCIGK